MPLTDGRDRHPKQFRQHRGRVKPCDAVARVNEAQSVHKAPIRDRTSTSSDEIRDPQIIVEKLAVRHQSLEIGRSSLARIRSTTHSIGIDNPPTMFTNDPLRVAARHARQFTEHQHSLTGEKRICDAVC